MQTIQDQAAAESQQRNKLDKYFFGRESALRVHHDKETNRIYLSIGKKDSNNNWTWENADFKDIKAADIFKLLRPRPKPPAYSAASTTRHL